MARQSFLRAKISGLCLLLFFALAILMIPASLSAQSLALLTGTAVDPSGAVVPGAKIVCQNVQTRLTYTTTTNAEGLFRCPDLPIGTYQLEVEGSGFENLVRSGIVLMTGHTVDLTLRLKVGSSVQSVTVTGGYQVIQPTSSELQTTIDSQGMSNLPLNGRNALQLVVLTPGATDTQGQNGGSLSFQSANDQIAVNGNRGTDNTYTLDGADYTDVHYGTVPILPNPDALEEFSVKSSNFSASQPGAGASVQFTTRSGTNQVHGSAFEFLRNNALDSRNYFSSTVTPFKRNQYGGTVGGPILKNKSFFFIAYQGTRAVGGASPSVATPPSATLRGGNFSGLSSVIIDPDTGAPFQGNTIPSTRFDALAVKFLPYIPLPNQANGTYISAPRNNQDDDQVLAKIDYSFSPKDHLIARYFYDNFSFQLPASPFPAIYGLDTFHNRNLLVSETHTFNPNFVVVSAFAYTRVPRAETGVLPTTAEALGAQVPPGVIDALPQLSVTIDNYAPLTSSAPVNFKPSTLNWRLNFTKVQGRHILQFGIDVFRDHEIDFVQSNTVGSWTFNGSRTASSAIGNSGNAFADFLLGLPFQFIEYGTSSPAVNLIEMRVGPWIQDDWKVLPNLTLNLGLRWDPWLPAMDLEGPQPAFEPGVRSTVAPGSPTGLLFSGDAGLKHSIFPNDWNNLAPRVGFAWDVGGSQKTVIRGAYGVFFRPVPLNNVRFSSDTAAFRSLDVTLSDPPSFENPWAGYPGGVPFPFIPLSSSQLKTYVFPNPVASAALIPNSPTSYVQEWNFTVERQIQPNLGISLSYVGNHMVKGMDSTEGNPALYKPGATEANANERRPYPGIASLQLLKPFAFSNYNSLQLTVTKRASHGLSVLGNYVYSKCMDNNSNTTGTVTVIDKLNPNLDYALCDFNITHAANLSLMYDLPKLPSLHGPADKLLNHWALTTILTANTGFPFSAFSGEDNSLTGPTTNSSVNDLTDRVKGANTARPPGANPLTEYFNTAAYVPNALGTFGDSGRNSLTAPHAWIWDFGLLKYFPLTATSRLEFRFEAFNFLNHTNFDAPVNTQTSTEFGQILAAGDPRVIQLAGKLVF